MIHTDHLLTEFTLGMYDENTMSAVYRMDAEEYADYDKALAAVKEGFFHGKIRTSNPRLYTLLARYVDGSRGLGREVRQDNRQMIADLTRQNALHYIECSFGYIRYKSCLPTVFISLFLSRAGATSDCACC